MPIYQKPEKQEKPQPTTGKPYYMVLQGWAEKRKQQLDKQIVKKNGPTP